MKIYELSVPEGYEWVVPPVRGDAHRIRGISGVAQADAWQPVPVELLDRDSNGKPRAYADCPWLGNDMLVFRQGARRRVESAIRHFGEFLPLVCKQTDLDLFNVLTVVDALDEEKSRIVQFGSSGKVMTIERYEFHPEKLPERAMFRIPETPETIFYTEKLANELDSFELRGLYGKKVWQSA